MSYPEHGGRMFVESEQGAKRRIVETSPVPASKTSSISTSPTPSSFSGTTNIQNMLPGMGKNKVDGSTNGDSGGVLLGLVPGALPTPLSPSRRNLRLTSESQKRASEAQPPLVSQHRSESGLTPLSQSDSEQAVQHYEAGPLTTPSQEVQDNIAVSEGDVEMGEHNSAQQVDHAVDEVAHLEQDDSKEAELDHALMQIVDEQGQHQQEEGHEVGQENIAGEVLHEEPWIMPWRAALGAARQHQRRAFPERNQQQHRLQIHRQQNEQAARAGPLPGQGWDARKRGAHFRNQIDEASFDGGGGHNFFASDVFYLDFNAGVEKSYGRKKRGGGGGANNASSSSKSSTSSANTSTKNQNENQDSTSSASSTSKGGAVSSSSSGQAVASSSEMFATGGVAFVSVTPAAKKEEQQLDDSRQKPRFRDRNQSGGLLGASAGLEQEDTQEEPPQQQLPIDPQPEPRPLAPTADDSSCQAGGRGCSKKTPERSSPGQFAGRCQFCGKPIIRGSLRVVERVPYRGGGKKFFHPECFCDLFGTELDLVDLSSIEVPEQVEEMRLRAILKRMNKGTQ
ncbi:unnamed protein product [Amoebophrya sp. A25]|nr:unnamed protein product [Amoebophrya sp. A25]|eukprot:GSA25T00010543001.1